MVTLVFKITRSSFQSDSLYIWFKNHLPYDRFYKKNTLIL